jgi:hypothetical protein
MCRTKKIESNKSVFFVPKAMDTDIQKKKWHGSQEKMWEWYKHTKPCNNMLNSHTCSREDCNYAHSLEQYITAITRRKFKPDDMIVNQLKLLDSELQPAKRMRTD